MTAADRRDPHFSVHARHVDSHHARVLEEASFEAAAVAYVEDLPSARRRRATRSASSCARSRPATSTASASTSTPAKPRPAARRTIRLETDVARESLSR